jgi:hypothetical protein
MNDLLTVAPSALGLYLAMALQVPLFVRVGNSAVEAKRLKRKNGFWLIVKGVGEEGADTASVPSDYWLAFVLGFGEMLAYPLLRVTNHALFIGAWLLFKTVHRWHYAPDQARGLYNRYVVGNAIVLIGAYLSARWNVAI